MIKHIVMWKFKDGEEENTKKFLEGLNSLKNIIPEIKYMETGIDINPKNAYDAILISEFETMEDLEKYKNIYWDKNDIISTGVYCHILLDYYLNNLLKEDYFIYNEDNIITGMKTLNGIFYGDRPSCIKFKHKNFNLIAQWLGVENKFSFPKQNIDIKTDDGIYTITPRDIELTELWIFEHNKNPKSEFPQNELITEKGIDKFFKDSKEFVLNHIKF